MRKRITYSNYTYIYISIDIDFIRQKNEDPFARCRFVIKCDCWEDATKRHWFGSRAQVDIGKMKGQFARTIES